MVQLLFSDLYQHAFSSVNCCRHFQRPSHGSVQYNGNNCYGDTAVVTCDNGYGISEPASGSSVTITCTADGTWSKAVPTCTGMDISNHLTLPLPYTLYCEFAVQDRTRINASYSPIFSRFWPIFDPLCFA